MNQYEQNKAELQEAWDNLCKALTEPFVGLGGRLKAAWKEGLERGCRKP